MKYYILNGHDLVAVDNLVDWGKWYETAERHVAQDYVGDMCISTVFLGTDHSFGDSAFPVLFETMLFDAGGHDLNMWRYATWDEAEAGHAIAVKKAKELYFSIDKEFQNGQEASTP